MSVGESQKSGLQNTWAMAQRTGEENESVYVCVCVNIKIGLQPPQQHQQQQIAVDLLRLSCCYDHIVRNQIFFNERIFNCATLKIPKIPLVISRGYDCRKNLTNWETVLFVAVGAVFCNAKSVEEVASFGNQLWQYHSEWGRRDWKKNEKEFEVVNGWWTKEID